MLNKEQIQLYQTIEIKTNYGKELKFENMLLPISAELLFNNMVGFYTSLPQNNRTSSSLEITYPVLRLDEPEYKLGYLQLGYTGVTFVNNQPIMQNIQIPYNELRKADPELRNPLQFYNSSGRFEPGQPLITAANNRLQYISPVKVIFKKTNNSLLFFDTTEFHFSVGGPFGFNENIYNSTPPLYIEPETNIRCYTVTEFALVMVNDRINNTKTTESTLLNSNNININNFRIYAYKFLYIPLIISQQYYIDIKWIITIKNNC